MSPLARFLMAGGIAALANVGIRTALDGYLNLVAATTVAYLAGMLIAYALNRRYVFASSGPVASEVLRFAIVNAMSMVVVVAVTLLLARVVFPSIGFTWQGDTVAHAIGVAAPVLLAFVAHRSFTFRRADASFGEQHDSIDTG